MRHPVLLVLATCFTLMLALVTLCLGLPFLVAPATGALAAPADAALASDVITSSCNLVADKIASPPVILLGDTVDVTLTFRAACSDTRFPLHLVLVLDGSTSMGGPPLLEMKRALVRLVDLLEMDVYPTTRVGVVQFNQQAQTLCQLTNVATEVAAAIGRVRANGNTRIDLGVQEGIQVLETGRDGMQQDELTEVLIVFSDGQNNGGCPAVLQAAGLAKGRGFLVMTVCVGTACDQACMRQAATTPSYYFLAERPDAIARVVETLRDRVLNVFVRSVQVVEKLPPNVAYVDGSALPPPSQPPDPTDWLAWEADFPPREGLTYSLKVRPLRTGRQPVNLQATGKLVDNQRRVREWLYDVPWVLVLAPEPLVTPPSAPTPTLPPTASAPPPTTLPPTATAPPTAAPTPTRTPVLTPLFLPFALREPRYVPWVRHADVALVLDLSTSMRQPTASGSQTKLAATLGAAAAFAARLQFEPGAYGRHDRLAIVGFNDDAWIELPLGNDRLGVDRALRALPQRVLAHTRLDLGLAVGAAALRAGRGQTDNLAVLIVLTDGLPSHVPLAEDGSQTTTVLRAASAAKAEGVVVFTIGVGSADPTAPLEQRVDAGLLAACASRPDMFFHEPGGDNLDAVYASIIERIDLAGGRHKYGVPWPPTPVPWNP